MAEQIILWRHGRTDGNEAMLVDRNHVQGNGSHLVERGHRQVAWVAQRVGFLVMERLKREQAGEEYQGPVVLLPTVIFAPPSARHMETAAEIQKAFKWACNLDLDILKAPELAEKGEPYVLEEKSGAEIAAYPLLQSVADAIRGHQNDYDFVPPPDIDPKYLEGFQTWHDKFEEIGPLISRVAHEPGCPILVTSAGTGGTVEAHLDHGFQLRLIRGESHDPNEMLPSEMFEHYLFKMNNAEARLWLPGENGDWHMQERFLRPVWL